MIDAKTAFDSLSGDGVPEDRRTAVDIIAVKADLEEESNTSLRWNPGEQQASADLTKWLGNGLMALLLATGRWCIQEDPAIREKRKRLREPYECREGQARGRKERCASNRLECRCAIGRCTDQL